MWGRAYLPLGRALALVLFTPAVFLLLLGLDWGWRQLSGEPSTDDKATR